MDVVVENLDVFARGFWLTVQLTLLGAVGALLLGTLIAAMRVSPIPPLRAFAVGYTEVVRNTPLTVVFTIAIFGLPKLDLTTSLFRFAVLALAVYTSAFVAEAVRSGINSVAAGQAEAARSIGMSFSQTLSLVVLPQAFRNIVPPLASIFIALLKNTSIAAAFGTREGTQTMQQLINANGQAVIPIILASAAGYVVLALGSGFLFSRLERRLAVAR
ncbi:MAG TPA: amino acid ABC transporter permease [Mycobacteriales bacterium]|nr:amino acid ABC transporter permease [Mycobacteriales bacterium]